MASPAEEIKERLDIVGFIRNYLELRQAGKNFKALCPFHGEKTPSFIVSPERQTWHCFGCGKGGDIFGFLMAYENLEFYEALKVLAEKAGVELKQLSPADQRQFGVLYDVNSAARNFFQESLSASSLALKYLAERKLKPETISEFEIGFAPNGTDEATLYLLNEGFSIEDIVRAGLTFKTERGKYMDRFRGRVMFPIHNHFGKVVGFSGRSLPEFESPEMGKYVNSPETPIFNKSRLLYGFWKSKGPIREANSVLLLEGQMDFLMSWQDGTKNIAAASGTALTIDHLKALRRITEKLFIGFDGDDAGQMATERAIDLAGAGDFNVAVVSWGKFKDAGEAVAEEPGFVGRAVAAAKPAMEYYFDRYLGDADAAGRKRNTRLLLSKIRNLWSKIDQSAWLKELAHRTGVREAQLEEEMERLPEQPAAVRGAERFADSTTVENLPKPESRIELLAERLLSLIGTKSELGQAMEPDMELLPPKYRAVYDYLKAGSPVSAQKQTAELAAIISMRSSFESDSLEGKLPEEEFSKLLRELELECLKEESEKLRIEISQAERAGRTDETAAKMELFANLSRKVQDIKNGHKK